MTNKSAPYMDGWHAQRTGKSVTLNPHDLAVSLWSSRQWDAGWYQRLLASNQDGDLSLDNSDGW